jgi:hypothetical protein
MCFFEMFCLDTRVTYEVGERLSPESNPRHVDPETRVTRFGQCFDQIDVLRRGQQMDEREWREIKEMNGMNLLSLCLGQTLHHVSGACFEHGRSFQKVLRLVFRLLGNRPCVNEGVFPVYFDILPLGC